MPPAGVLPVPPQSSANGSGAPVTGLGLPKMCRVNSFSVSDPLRSMAAPTPAAPAATARNAPMAIVVLISCVLRYRVRGWRSRPEMDLTRPRSVAPLQGSDQPERTCDDAGYQGKMATARTAVATRSSGYRKALSDFRTLAHR